MHLHENAEHRFERGDKALLALRDLSQRVGKVLRRHLDEHIQRVGVADAVNHDLIIGRIPLLRVADPAAVSSLLAANGIQLADAATLGIVSAD